MLKARNANNIVQRISWEKKFVDLRWCLLPFLLLPLLFAHFGIDEKSFGCEDAECKRSNHQNCQLAACRRSFIVASILNNNNRSLNASRNNSFCSRPTNVINNGTHARRIAQILLSPTGSSLAPTNCPSCPRRESTISDTVCSTTLYDAIDVFRSFVNGPAESFMSFLFLLEVDIYFRLFVWDLSSPNIDFPPR